MAEETDIPFPVRLNPLKHHRNYNFDRKVGHQKLRTCLKSASPGFRKHFHWEKLTRSESKLAFQLLKRWNAAKAFKLLR